MGSKWVKMANIFTKNTLQIFGPPRSGWDLLNHLRSFVRTTRFEIRPPSKISKTHFFKVSFIWHIIPFSGLKFNEELISAIKFQKSITRFDLLRIFDFRL